MNRMSSEAAFGFQVSGHCNNCPQAGAPFTRSESTFTRRGKKFPCNRAKCTLRSGDLHSRIRNDASVINVNTYDRHQRISLRRHLIGPRVRPTINLFDSLCQQTRAILIAGPTSADQSIHQDRSISGARLGMLRGRQRSVAEPR